MSYDKESKPDCTLPLTHTGPCNTRSPAPLSAESEAEAYIKKSLVEETPASVVGHIRHAYLAGYASGKAAGVKEESLRHEAHMAYCRDAVAGIYEAENATLMAQLAEATRIAMASPEEKEKKG